MGRSTLSTSPMTTAPQTVSPTALMISPLKKK
jgi:hypothetical protein